MPIVTPNFNFRGQCEEAIALYEKAFGAKTKILIRYSQADKRDMDIPLTEEQKNLVYHAELFIGKQRVMLCDVTGFNQPSSTALFLTLIFEHAEEVMRAYEVLKDGCTIIYPLQSTTYSSCFVSLIDKFGFRWGLMTENS